MNSELSTSALTLAEGKKSIAGISVKGVGGDRIPDNIAGLGIPLDLQGGSRADSIVLYRVSKRTHMNQESYKRTVWQPPPQATSLAPHMPLSPQHKPVLPGPQVFPALLVPHLSLSGPEVDAWVRLTKVRFLSGR